MRAVPVVAVIAVACAVGAAVAWAATSSDSAQPVNSVAAEPATLTTAVVARKDLVTVTEIDGTLGFGVSEALPNRASGVLTWLPEPGTIIEIGDVLYEVNDVPVLYLPGDVPAFRAMGNNTEGSDVLQLETYLDDLGLMETANATVDGDYTSYTANAVEDWYDTTFGISDLSTVGDGMVVFGSEGFRVSSLNGTLGSTINGGSVINYTSTSRIVSVQLDPALNGTFVEGQSVVVELPDSTEVDATVTLVAGAVTTEGQGQAATSWIDVELVLNGSGGSFDESPVTVRVDDAIQLDALVVPVSSLLALAEGGYGVEVMVGDVPTLIGVEPLNFLNNEVSINAAIEPGAEVVVP